MEALGALRFFTIVSVDGRVHGVGCQLSDLLIHLVFDQPKLTKGNKRSSK
jgi:hypothetical protein